MKPIKENTPLTLAACGVFFAAAMAVWAVPSWWQNRDVTTSGATTNDWAPAVAGQLKHLATQAEAELKAHLPHGAGAAVAATVAGFQNTNNYTAINLGQLKQVAQPFYDRLITEGVVTSYPWTASTTDDADHAPATLGQVKNVFAFDLTLDTDDDGMPDWWEIHYGLNPTSTVPGAGEGWWKFDESSGTNAANSAGAGYTGQLVNMATNAWMVGKLGNALSFDGTNDYVRVPQPSAMITGLPFTASGWVWLDPENTNDYATLVADMSVCGGGYPGFWVGYDRYTPGVALLGGVCDDYGYAVHAVALTGRWAHIAGSFDGSSMRLYVDGVLISTASGSFTPALQSEVRIGWANDPAYTYHWKGKLDDVRLYKTALSGDAVATMYDALLDPDGDGLSNIEEYQNGTYPTSSDTDGDGLDDGVEVFMGTNPLEDADYDEDGLSDAAEVLVWDTDPLNSDTDSDELGDGLEVNTYGTNPTLADTDGDGLLDGEEVMIYGSDPFDPGNPATLPPVSMKIESDCGEIHLNQAEAGRGTVYAHLTDFAVCSQQEAETGRWAGVSCDSATMYPTTGRGFAPSKATYTTVDKLGSRMLHVMVDSYFNDPPDRGPGAHVGRLRLYRGVFTDDPVIVRKADSNTIGHVTKISTNEIEWECTLDNVTNLGHGGVIELRFFRVFRGDNHWLNAG